MKRELFVVIERDEDGMLVGEAPQLRGCYAQGRTLDEVLANLREVINLCLDDECGNRILEFIGIHKLVIDDPPAHL